MNELINQVTPLTRGIIWFTKNMADSANPHYEGIDYLLDGLLTANIHKIPNASSRVIIGQNFNNPLYVLVVSEVKNPEIQSFLALFEKDLTPENSILMIDELNIFQSIKSEFKSIATHLKQF